MHTLPHSVPLTLQQATINSCLRQSLLDTHRQMWANLLWGHRSFLLGPGVQKVLFVPSKSLFPQSCVSFGGTMVRLMVTPSKRAYAIPRSAAPDFHNNDCQSQLLICLQLPWVLLPHRSSYTYGQGVDLWCC